MRLDWTEADLATNLALDESLLIAAEEGTGPTDCLRFWEVAQPAVVLGASCRRLQDVWVEACQADGVPLGRRSSGGGTVVLGPGALCVTIVRPLASLPDTERSVDLAQRWVLERTGAALRALGAEVVMLGSGDLTIGGRKFVGSAQRRLRHHWMIHFSLLYNLDLRLIERYLRLPTRQPDYRVGRSHADFVANLPLPRAAIVQAIGAIWGDEPVTPVGELAALRDRSRDLATTKFRDPDWIERL